MANLNCRIITIDIETLPASEEFVKQFGARLWTDEDEQRKSSLRGAFGRLLCIGYMDERADGTLKRGCIGWNKETEDFSVDERALLTRFWSRLRDFRVGIDSIVGHNIYEFDLPFIYQRSIVNGVCPTIRLPFARYRSQPIFDTMCEWECWHTRHRISLDNLAVALGLPSPKAGGVGGGNVAELFAAGEHKTLLDYCLRDVATTRDIYQRMMFAGVWHEAARSPTSLQLLSTLGADV